MGGTNASMNTLCEQVSNAKAASQGKNYFINTACQSFRSTLSRNGQKTEDGFVGNGSSLRRPYTRTNISTSCVELYQDFEII